MKKYKRRIWKKKAKQIIKSMNNPLIELRFEEAAKRKGVRLWKPILLEERGK